MSTDEADLHNLNAIVYLHNKPVFVPANVEYHTAVSQNAGCPIHFLYLVRILPIGVFHLDVPGSQAFLSIRSSLTKTVTVQAPTWSEAEGTE